MGPTMPSCPSPCLRHPPPHRFDRPSRDPPSPGLRTPTGSRPPSRLHAGWCRPCSPCWPSPRVPTCGTSALSGYANSFYAAAVQAGTKSWKAFFFGSLDSSNFITVDKSPGSLWVMELSGRLFGFNSWSMLVPQVLEGVAAVGLVYAAVKRWFGPAAGLLAGAVLAVHPGGRPHVPVQQPGRADGAAAGGRGLHPDPRPRERRAPDGSWPPGR